MLKFMLVSVTAAALGLTVSVAQGSYMTSFETADGFTAGNSPDNVAGWDAFGSPVTVTASQSSDGAQSIQIGDDGADGDGVARQFNTTETASGVDTVLEFDFNPSASSGADEQVLWVYAWAGDATGNLAIGRIYLINDGIDADPNPILQYTPISGTGTATNLALPVGAWTNGAWNTMQIALDAVNQQFDITLNGQTVATNLAVDDDTVTAANRISRFSFFDQGAAGSLYLDRVSVHAVPEPATLALVGLGGVMMLSRRRRS